MCCDKRFQAFVYRHNLPGTVITDIDKKWNGSLEKTLEDCRRYYVLWNQNRPGADMFIWSRAIFEEIAAAIPPVNMLAWGLERAFWKYGFNHPRCSNYELSNNITLAHFQHELRKNGSWTSDDKTFEETEDPLCSYNRNFVPEPATEIWRGMAIRFSSLLNGLILQEIIKVPEPKAQIITEPPMNFMPMIKE